MFHYAYITSGKTRGESQHILNSVPNISVTVASTAWFPSAFRLGITGANPTYTTC